MFHLTLPVKKAPQQVKKVPMPVKKVSQHTIKATQSVKNPQTCPKEAIAWAAERMCLSYEQLKVSLTAEEMAGVKIAYESWKERTKDDNKLPG